MAELTIAREIEINEDEVLRVYFLVSATYGNHGIGDYEYWGFRGRDVQIGWEVDDVSWDKSLFTDEQNALIEKFYDTELDSIIKDFMTEINEF